MSHNVVGGIADIIVGMFLEGKQPAGIEFGIIAYKQFVAEIDLIGIEDPIVRDIMSLTFRVSSITHPYFYRVLTQRFLEMEKEYVTGRLKRD